MKYVLIAFFILLFIDSNAQICNGDITLSTQAQINSFSDDYGNCSSINGNLIIGTFGNDITSLQGLSDITSISGYLIIIQCNSLISLAGLSSLNSIGGLRISSCPILSDMSQLQGVTSSLQDLTISATKLITLNGLQNVSDITGSISISGNPDLASVAAITHVNPSGNLNISFSPFINNISFPNITSVSNLSFEALDQLQSIFLPNLTSVNSAYVRSNPVLENLLGFTKLQSVSTVLSVNNNDALVDLNGLESLNTVDQIFIKNNDELLTLEGLGSFNVTTTNFVEIASNPKLETCNIASICQFVNAGGTMTVIGNPGCTSVGHLSNTCNNDDNPIVNPPENDQCYTVVSTNISGTGWTNILNEDLDIVCSIDPNGNNLGMTDFILYNSTENRTDNSGNTYINRDFSINPSNQPSSAVSVRFYFTAAEYQELLNNDPNISSLSDINFTKVDADCSGVFPGGGEYVFQTGSGFYGPFGDIFIETTVTSFSTFFASANSLTLPVEWSQPLHVESLENGNLLSWSVSKQVNNDRFEVEHSSDGRDFYPVGRILGDGNEFAERKFEFMHRSDASDISYYRIKQVDFDGKYSYSNTVSINNRKRLNKYIITSTPSEVMIQSEVEDNLLVFNNLGQRVATFYVEKGINHFPIHRFSPGIYFLVDEGGSQSHKFLKP